MIWYSFCLVQIRLDSERLQYNTRKFEVQKVWNECFQRVNSLENWHFSPVATRMWIPLYLSRIIPFRKSKFNQHLWPKLTFFKLEYLWIVSWRYLTFQIFPHHIIVHHHSPLQDLRCATSLVVAFFDLAQPSLECCDCEMPTLWRAKRAAFGAATWRSQKDSYWKHWVRTREPKEDFTWLFHMVSHVFFVCPRFSMSCSSCSWFIRTVKNWHLFGSYLLGSHTCSKLQAGKRRFCQNCQSLWFTHNIYIIYIYICFQGILNLYMSKKFTPMH